MAARPLFLVPMAPLLVLVLLSRVPLAAPASFLEPLEDLFPKSGTANATTTSAPAPPANASSSSQQQQQEKALDDAAREWGRANGVVSPTNFTGSYKGMARDFVNAHNVVRARYGVPPLTWDKKVARHARRWATAIRRNCKLQHSGNKYGESIFLSQKTWNATAKDAVAFWCTEEAIYDKVTGNCTGGKPFADCGHFAILVSKGYQRVGCARVECVHGGVFVSCNYAA
ncbi:pathogenesis-related protein 1A-like [Panicum virgatum]|uniref:pathogenesis-related protein 1A-like n=1 Tax=Panicum virgatum TaxID=38727 RepID=UPI0019D60943|nr:pathogenesis-related protein 1A-like [Panicum virgatum]